MEMICTGTAQGRQSHLYAGNKIKVEFDLFIFFFCLMGISQREEGIRSFHFENQDDIIRRREKKLVLKLIFSLNSEFVFHSPKQKNIKLSVDKLSIQVRHFHKRILISLPLQARPQTRPGRTVREICIFNIQSYICHMHFMQSLKINFIGGACNVRDDGTLMKCNQQ